jgi:hypothetical protein
MVNQMVAMFLDIIHRLVFIYKPSRFFPQNTTFRKLGSVSVLRQNLLCWAQSIELIPISGHLHQHQEVIYHIKHSTN